jgi:hypothetical protein
VIAIAAYAEFALDIRAPRSDLRQEGALGASASLSLGEYNKRVEQMHAAYGDRASVALDPSTGRMTVSLDGKLIEERSIAREFAGMYGMFVVTTPGAPESIFPFALEPGQIPSSHEPNVARLQSHFEGRMPAKFLAFKDADWTRDSCVSPKASDLGLGGLAALLRLRAETFCVVRWNGKRPSSMLIGVTRADGDPWMRPFARWICRTVTEAALNRFAPDREPTYAACVLVDRSDRTGPTGAQDAFTATVYEVRNRTLARMD